MAHLGRHAIVIGASMGGLLAARALADHYDEVTVLERDTLPEAHEPRKGVPQGRHAARAARPRTRGTRAALPWPERRNGSAGRCLRRCRRPSLWFNHGVYLLNSPSALLGLLISR